MGRKKIEIKPGDQYGRLTLIKEIEPHILLSGKKIRKMLCRCSCSNKKEVLLKNLKRGHTTSCGCLHKEKVKKANSTHGLTSHPLYSVWGSMKDRCYRPKTKQYKDYGGRGITVCQEWLDDFKYFYDWALSNDWKKGLQIDRIDNDGNYEPTNCRFVTSRDNNLNQRIPSNNTSGYRCVYYRKDNNRWCTSVSINNKNYHIGSYTTAEEAAIAYNLFVVLNNLPNKLNEVK